MRDQIKEHMQVTDAAGQPVGKVDSVDGDRIKLTRSDSADGQHHMLSLDEVDRVEGNQIYLKQDAQVPQGV